MICLRQCMKTFCAFRHISSVCRVYYKTFAAVKFRPSLVDGSPHLFNQIQNIKSLFKGEDLKLLLKSVQTNCYFAHPENIIVAMLASPYQDARIRAVEIISNIRSFPLESFGPRPFILPQLKTEAESYSLMCNIKKNRNGQLTYKSNQNSYLPLTEPPLLIKQSMEDTKEYITVPLACDFPCHTQATERGVKLTSGKVSRITGAKRQISEALCTIKARKLFPGPVIRKNSHGHSE